MDSSNYKNKLPSELTTDDLISSLNEQDDAELINYDTNVPQFLSSFKITSGATPIRSSLLYNLYYLYTSEPVTKYKFGLECGKYLFNIRLNNNRYFLINQSTITINNALFSFKKKRDKRKSPHYQKHFENYLNFYGLTEGKMYIEGYVLFYLYDKWCFSIKKKNQLSYDKFINFCRIHLKNKRIPKGEMFAVDSNILNYVTKKQIEEIKKARKTKSKRKNEI